MTYRSIDTGSANGSASVATQKQRGQEFFVNTGEKVTLKKIVRSQKTGMYLPKEGTLVDITENVGRRLLLVDFGDGNCEYLFDDEVECSVCDPRDITDQHPRAGQWPKKSMPEHHPGVIKVDKSEKNLAEKSLSR